MNLNPDRAPGAHALPATPSFSLCSFVHGQSVLFSARAPDKLTPNEDTVALIPFGEDAGLLVVADGLGGMPEGEEASRLAVAAIREVLEHAQGEGMALRDALLDGIEQANRTVLARGSGAATTLAAVELSGAAIRPYHIGDSLILVTGQRGRIKHQSISHSPVGYAIEAGLLHEDEAVHHEERHLVSNVLGGQDMRIEIGPSLRLAPRDTLIVASDGLADNLYVNEIVEAARKGPLQLAAERLAGLAQQRMCEPVDGAPSHPDDLSFVLYRRDPR